jgi:hypothetical protein
VLIVSVAWNVILGVLLASGLLVVLLDVIWTSKRGGLWRALANMKDRDPEWGVFGPGLALVFIGAAGTENHWFNLAAIPAYGFLFWYLRKTSDHSTLAPNKVIEPADEAPSNVRLRR